MTCHWQGAALGKWGPDTNTSIDLKAKQLGPLVILFYAEGGL